MLLQGGILMGQNNFIFYMLSTGHYILIVLLVPVKQ